MVKLKVGDAVTDPKGFPGFIVEIKGNKALVEDKYGRQITYDLSKLKKKESLNLKQEKVEKRGNEWCVVHCTGPDKGKVIACHDTKEKAEAQHKAILDSKAKGESFISKIIKLASKIKLESLAKKLNLKIENK